MAAEVPSGGTLGVNIEWKNPTDKADIPKYRLLSCNHVLAKNVEKRVVYQPDRIDLFNVLSTVSGCIPVVVSTGPDAEWAPPYGDSRWNTYDLAWCDVDDRVGSRSIIGVGVNGAPLVPEGVRAPEKGETVRLYGSWTQEVKVGVIKEVENTEGWSSEEWGGIVWWKDKIVLDGKLVTGGDSGAALVGEDGYVVGLAFAAGKDEKTGEYETYACRVV